MYRKKSIHVVPLLAVLVSACGGSDATEPEEVVLDQVAGMQIASTLMSEIITIGFSALAGGSGSAHPALTPAAGLIPITQTVPCQGGGTNGAAVPAASCSARAPALAAVPVGFRSMAPSLRGSCSQGLRGMMPRSVSSGRQHAWQFTAPTRCAAG